LRVVLEADGGSRGNPGPAGYGAVVRDAVTGAVLAERAAGIGTATNNVAEYGGLIAGLKAARELGADDVEVRMDSKLVVEQMSGNWKVKHPSMQPLAREASELVRAFDRVRFSWIPRAENTHADRLANEAMDAARTGKAWQPDAAEQWLGENDPARRAEPEPAASLHEAAPNRLPGWQDPSAPPTTMLLLRHGQTPLSVEKRFSGTGDATLTEVGPGDGRRRRAPAGRQRRRRRRVEPAASRAADGRGGRRRARSRRGRRGGPAGDRLRRLGGLHLRRGEAEVAARARRVAGLHRRRAAVRRELRRHRARVRAARDRILERYGGRTVVVVSHVTPIKTLLRFALDAPPSALYRMHLDLVSLSEVQWFADGPAVVRSLNDTHHYAPPA
jgi:probable phosphoglycerate mutase